MSGRGCRGEITSGVISINGIETKGTTWNSTSIGGLNTFKSGIGFIPQDDVHLYNEMTVRETLFWTARFQLNGCNKRKIIKWVQYLLDILNLAHIQDMQVGIISGGERRRVSIGISLAGKPKVLICDEPTSGLDSSSAMGVMTILKNLAHNERISVISSLHQSGESIFSLLDDLILLRQGTVIFNGEAKNAIGYFRTQGYHDIRSSSLNPADILIDICTGSCNKKDNVSSRRKMPSCSIQHDDLSHHLTSMKESRSKNRSNPTLFRKNISSYYLWKERSSAATQCYYQVQRNLLLLRRNMTTKIVDTSIMILGSSLVSWLEGVSTIVDEHMEHPISFENIESKHLPFIHMFQFSVKPVFSKQE